MRLVVASLVLGQHVLSYQVVNDARSQIQFLRVRRKNSGFFEESRDDDLTRECHQEMCSLEELTEVMDRDEAKVKAEWNRLTRRCYVDKCGAQGTKVCLQEWNKRTCNCKTGFNGDTCEEDIDECNNGSHNCGDAECTNTFGSFTCGCFTGYEQDASGKCQDINECVTDANTCDLSKSKCVNQPGSHYCECNEGFFMNEAEGVCVDVNECDEANLCGPNAVCLNNEGSYSCECEPGYHSVGGVCVDKNECEDGIDCGHGSCINTLGGFQCECDVGYDNEAGKQSACVDINECKDNVCGLDEKCHNYDGGHRCCANSEDFDSNSKQCISRDPCEAVVCGANSKCVAGSCKCNSGYEQDEDLRSDGFMPLKEIISSDDEDGSAAAGLMSPCVDVNECLGNPCGPSQDCTNTDGGFKCTDRDEPTTPEPTPEPTTEPPMTRPQDNQGVPNHCDAGFEPNHRGQCVDKDECQENNGHCGGMCMNYYGGKRCYERLAEERSMCHHYSVRNNAASSETQYSCKCFKNYVLCTDNFSCVTKDGFNKYDSQGNFKYTCDKRKRCPGHQFDVEGTCYSIPENKASYVGAKRACADLGGSLVNLKKRMTWWVVGNKINYGESSFWVDEASSADMYVLPEGASGPKIANLAENMDQVPPQLNVVSPAEQHRFACQF